KLPLKIKSNCPRGIGRRQSRPKFGMISTRTGFLNFSTKRGRSAVQWVIAGTLSCGLIAAPAQVVVAIGQNFTASTYRVDAAFLPPDSDGAAGPQHFVELINGRFSVFNKSDASKVQTMTDIAFWTQGGITFPSGWDVTDPRIIYDPSSQRWF